MRTRIKSKYEKELEIRDVMVGDWIDVRTKEDPNSPHLEKITPSHFLRDEHWYGIRYRNCA